LATRNVLLRSTNDPITNQRQCVLVDMGLSRLFDVDGTEYMRTRSQIPVN